MLALCYNFEKSLALSRWGHGPLLAQKPGGWRCGWVGPQRWGSSAGGGLGDGGLPLPLLSAMGARWQPELDRASRVLFIFGLRPHETTGTLQSSGRVRCHARLW